MLLSKQRRTPRLFITEIHHLRRANDLAAAAQNLEGKETRRSIGWALGFIQ